MFESSYITTISNIEISIGKGLGWIIDSIVDHNINISKYNHLAGGSFIKLLKKLEHSKKTFVYY